MTPSKLFISSEFNILNNYLIISERMDTKMLLEINFFLTVHPSQKNYIVS